jgi:hypothetical protein
VRGFANGLSRVWGVATDDVKASTPLSKARPARLPRAKARFFYEGTTLPSTLILQLANGDRETVPVASMPTLRGASEGTAAGH